MNLLEPAVLTKISTLGFSLSAGAPSWLRQSLSTPVAPGNVDIEGNQIRYLGWNWDSTELPALLMLHGFRAHVHWWGYVVPLLLPGYRMAAIDFSGMGGSGHRQSYDAMRSARDISGFIRHFELAPATVIAHSYGGAQLIRAASESPELFGHAILVDTYFNFPDHNEQPVFFPPLDSMRTTDHLSDLLSRFRLEPPQPHLLDDLLYYIAYRSARRTPRGWRWKFDPGLTNP